MPCVDQYDSGPSKPYDPEDDDERCLCRCRWLLREVYWHLEDGTTPGKEIRDMVDHEVTRQLAHRRVDRDHVVQHIQRDIDYIEKRQFVRIRDSGGEPGEQLLRKLHTLRTRRDQVQALTQEQLLDTYWGHHDVLHVDLESLLPLPSTGVAVDNEHREVHPPRTLRVGT
jgi:hypothetical protein